MYGLGRGLPFRLLGFAVLLFTAPGCAIEHPGLTASSGSGLPWFNFQVAPRKKDAKNYQRGISRQVATPVEVKHAMKTSPVTSLHWPDIRLPGRKAE